MRPNHVLRAWRNGGQTVGAWLSIDSAFTTEAMAHQDFDWLCIDTQHGLIEYETAAHMLLAISTTETIPFVRVKWNDPATIMKYLDAGAYGIIVPLVNNREEAERAVWACRYPPDGGRSFGPARATLYSGAGYVQEANNEIACIVMIETAEALENLDEIMSTPGVDAVYIGPSDLAYALDMQPAGDNNDPKHVATVEHIFEVAKQHGVAPGIHTGSAEFTSRWLKYGFQLVTLGADRAFMTAAAVSDLRTVREETGVSSIEPGE